MFSKLLLFIPFLLLVGMIGVSIAAVIYVIKYMKNK